MRFFFRCIPFLLKAKTSTLDNSMDQNESPEVVDVVTLGRATQLQPTSSSSDRSLLSSVRESVGSWMNQTSGKAKNQFLDIFIRDPDEEAEEHRSGLLTARAPTIVVTEPPSVLAPQAVPIVPLDVDALPPPSVTDGPLYPTDRIRTTDDEPLVKPQITITHSQPAWRDATDGEKQVLWLSARMRAPCISVFLLVVVLACIVLPLAIRSVVAQLRIE